MGEVRRMILEAVERHGIIAPQVLHSAGALREEFRAAKPFPHVVVDDFFTEDVARELLERFPVNRETGRRNEFGAPGIKVVNSDLTALAPIYGKAHLFFSSPGFLAWLSKATGIPRLLYDPQNYGGGTHENLEGRDLRPHVDFNIHPVTKLHRRVNLIVYLNEGWQPEWGGNITLHSDPRSRDDQTTAFAPAFNRCIIFETSERSWHSFDLIRLPDGEKHRSRKSLSLYFYTEERPDAEVHREHTTFFVPRTLPERYRAGYTLTEEDAEELDHLMGQRERLIALYQGELGRQESADAEAARLRILVARLRSHRHIPILGYARRDGEVTGMYDDGWGSRCVEFTLRALRPVRSMEVRAVIPQGMPDDAVLAVSVAGVECARRTAAAGTMRLHFPVRVEAAAAVPVRIEVSASVNHKALGISGDERDLGVLLDCVTLEHDPA